MGPSLNHKTNTLFDLFSTSWPIRDNRMLIALEDWKELVLYDIWWFRRNGGEGTWNGCSGRDRSAGRVWSQAN
jgi:hypothetical protein